MPLMIGMPEGVVSRRIVNLPMLTVARYVSICSVSSQTQVEVPAASSTVLEISCPLDITWRSACVVTVNWNVALSLVELLDGYHVSAPCGGVDVYEPFSV